MLHKNQQSLDTQKILKTIFEQNLSSISFDDAITKTYFFHKLGLISDVSVIYFDFDLLYSGYLAANLIPQNENLELLSPKEDNWKDLIVQTLDKISTKKHLVIIDSLNGFFATMPDQKDSGRIINSILILMASAAQKADSTVLVGSTAKYKEDRWFLPGIGRHVVQIKKMSFLAVRKQNDALNLVSLYNDNSVKSSIPISDLDLV